MAEVGRNAYATTAANAAAGTPNVVAVLNDGTADRQVMVIGDPTTAANYATVGANGQLYIQGYQPTATAYTGITTVSTTASLSCAGYNIVTLTLRTFTGTTPSVTFKLQASDDGGTTWVDIQGINNTTGLVAVTSTQASALSAGTGGPSLDLAIGAYTHVRISVTAISGTSATAGFGLALQTMSYEPSPGAIAQGLAGNAVTTTGNPVLVAGWNGTNTYTLKTDTSGQLVLGGGGSTIGNVGVIAASTVTGSSPSYQNALTNTKVVINASAGNLYGYHIYNPGTVTSYVQLFNLATGSVTLGTTTPTMVVVVPAGGWADTQLDVPITFGTALTVAATTTSTGLTAPATALNANFFFK